MLRWQNSHARRGPLTVLTIVKELITEVRILITQFRVLITLLKTKLRVLVTLLITRGAQPGRAQCRAQGP